MYPHNIDVFEAVVNNALTGFYVAIKNGESRTMSERAARDHIMKGWARTVYGHDAQQAIRRARAQPGQKADPDATIQIRAAL